MQTRLQLHTHADAGRVCVQQKTKMEKLNALELQPVPRLRPGCQVFQCRPSEMLTRSMDRLAVRASPLTARSISVESTLSVICSQLRATPRARAQWWLHIVVSRKKMRSCTRVCKDV